MNKVLLSGRLTRDALVKAYGENNEKKMARYTLACDRFGKHEEGQQTADFIGCVCYGKAADFADTYLRQGMKIIVEGRLVTGSYDDKDGKKVYTTDVFVERQEFCESKRTADHGDLSDASTASSGKPANVTTARNEEWMDIPAGAEESLPWE